MLSFGDWTATAAFGAIEPSGRDTPSAWCCLTAMSAECASAFQSYAAAQTQFSSVDVLQGKAASFIDVGKQIGNPGKMR
jgi:hypothetical protein